MTVYLVRNIAGDLDSIFREHSDAIKRAEYLMDLFKGENWYVAEWSLQ
jgi:hypothetical protein